MFSALLQHAGSCAQENNWSFTGMHRQFQGIFHRIWQFFDVTSCRRCSMECLMILQGTLGRNFDIFAASGESRSFDFRSQQDFHVTNHSSKNALAILLKTLSCLSVKIHLHCFCWWHPEKWEGVPWPKGHAPLDVKSTRRVLCPAVQREAWKR